MKDELEVSQVRREVKSVLICLACLFSRGGSKGRGPDGGIKHRLPWGPSDKESTCQCRRHGFDPWENPLVKEIAIHSSILAWEISWTEKPGRLQSVGLQKSLT